MFKDHINNETLSLNTQWVDSVENSTEIEAGDEIWKTAIKLA
jgi:hypothetical protein